MLVRPGVNVQTIIGALDQLLLNAYNHTADDESYVLFVSGLEVRLDEWFLEVPSTLLYSQRFWQISDGIMRRPHEMRRQECARVVRLLTSLRDTLKAMADRFGQAPGTIAVLDTNVLLHYRPITDVPWLEVVGSTTVTLVIPIRVLAELDEKKAAPNNPKLAKRAQTRVRMLEGLIGASDVRLVRDNVTVTVVRSADLDPEARRRPLPPPDVEILDTCTGLSGYAPRAVSLVTGDLWMKVLARESGIPLTPMPDDCYQPLGEPEEDQGSR
jgi:hypothetical protein